MKLKIKFSVINNEEQFHYILYKYFAKSRTSLLCDGKIYLVDIFSSIETIAIPISIWIIHIQFISVEREL